jgi:hypothetical protein
LNTATEVLSSSNFPTIATGRLIMLGTIQHLEECLNDSVFSQKTLCRKIKEKLDIYWELIDSTTYISTILDPRYKFSLFDTNEMKNQAKQIIKNAAENYNATIISNSIQNEKIHSSSETSTNLLFFQKLRRKRFQEQGLEPASTSLNLIEKELNCYELTRCGENIDPLEWWKVNQIEYPVLSKLACDYLPIQATSVECERTFSIAKNTITDRRNRLDPETVQASVCLKSWIDNEFCQKNK